MRAERGFTLIEILVALAIFGLLGMAAYSGLDATLKTRARLDAETRQWRDVALFWTRLGRDLAAAVDLTARPDGGAVRPGLLGEAVPIGADAGNLELTRLGEGDESGIGAALADDQPREAAFLARRAAPARVGYRLRDGRVEWLRWPSPDNAPRSQPEVHVLLEGIAALDFSYLDTDGSWSARWPMRENQTRPRAVRVELRLENGQRMSRLYAP